MKLLQYSTALYSLGTVHRAKIDAANNPPLEAPLEASLETPRTPRDHDIQQYRTEPFVSIPPGGHWVSSTSKIEAADIVNTSVQYQKRKHPIACPNLQASAGSSEHTTRHKAVRRAILGHHVRRVLQVRQVRHVSHVNHRPTLRPTSISSRKTTHAHQTSYRAKANSLARKLRIGKWQRLYRTYDAMHAGFVQSLNLSAIAVAP